MDWMSWKTWTVIALILVAAFAIYTFASTQTSNADDPIATSEGSRTARLQPNLPGVQPVHTEWLDGQTGSYRSDRNLFTYKEPPPPPPPAPPPPPPDRDKDGTRD